MRRLAAVASAVLMLQTSVLNAQSTETYPPVDGQLLTLCRREMTSSCLADIAWNLAREERRSFNAGQLAPIFAKLKQWRRADDLLGRIPNEDRAKALPEKYVAAERLAVALSEGNLEALKSVRDPLTLSVTASRLMGYLPRESVVFSDRIGKRINEGLWNSTLKADRSTNLVLVDHWSAVAGSSSNYLQIRLANALILLGDAPRARRIAQAIVANPKDVGRDHVELWLRLGEPETALTLIKSFEPRNRGLYKILVAKSFAKDGNIERAAAVALEAADDAMSTDDYDRLAMAAELLSQISKAGLAKQIAVQAEQRSQRRGPFQAFYISAVGEMYGHGGDRPACLRLEASALGAEGKGVVAWGLVSGPVGYGAGRFDLRPELRQNAATRSFRCGDSEALNAIDNRWLARNYCDYHRRGLFGPSDIDKRPHRRTDDDASRSLVIEFAAECHFEREETAIALPLLQQLVAEAQSSSDFFMAHSAAELACVYAPHKTCMDALRVAGNVLVKNVEARKFSAQRVAEFAVVWKHRAGS
ncbi:MAG TPA: hypothetical protein VFC18_17160 [Burkholderiales bacterium]|nr:hypothetical protein [Burkholderiales bacterium]